MSDIFDDDLMFIQKGGILGIRELQKLFSNWNAYLNTLKLPQRKINQAMVDELVPANFHWRRVVSKTAGGVDDVAVQFISKQDPRFTWTSPPIKVKSKRQRALRLAQPSRAQERRPTGLEYMKHFRATRPLFLRDAPRDMGRAEPERQAVFSAVYKEPEVIQQEREAEALERFEKPQYEEHTAVPGFGETYLWGEDVPKTYRPDSPIPEHRPDSPFSLKMREEALERRRVKYEQQAEAERVVRRKQFKHIAQPMESGVSDLVRIVELEGFAQPLSTQITQHRLVSSAIPSVVGAAIPSDVRKYIDEAETRIGGINLENPIYAQGWKRRPYELYGKGSAQAGDIVKYRSEEPEFKNQVYYYILGVDEFGGQLFQTKGQAKAELKKYSPRMRGVEFAKKLRNMPQNERRAFIRKQDELPTFMILGGIFWMMVEHSKNFAYSGGGSGEDPDRADDLITRGGYITFDWDTMKKWDTARWLAEFLLLPYKEQFDLYSKYEGHIYHYRWDAGIEESFAENIHMWRSLNEEEEPEKYIMPFMVQVEQLLGLQEVTTDWMALRQSQMEQGTPFDLGEWLRTPEEGIYEVEHNIQDVSWKGKSVYAKGTSVEPIFSIKGLNPLYTFASREQAEIFLSYTRARLPKELIGRRTQEDISEEAEHFKQHQQEQSRPDPKDQRTPRNELIDIMTGEGRGEEGLFWIDTRAKEAGIPILLEPEQIVAKGRSVWWDEGTGMPEGQVKLKVGGNVKRLEKIRKAKQEGLVVNVYGAGANPVQVEDDPFADEEEERE